MGERDDTPSLLLLFHAAAAGDRAALEALLRELYPALSRFARHRAQGWLSADDVADDIAQEAMIRIARNLRQCQATSDGQLLAWALSIARRALLDHLRSQPAPGEVLRFETEESVPIPDPASSAVDRWDEPPGAGSLLFRLVRNTCCTLPPESLRLLHLRVEMGAQWNQVAAELRTTPAGAKRRFQRLQVTFRRRLLRQIDALSPGAREHSRRLLGLESGKIRREENDEYTL
ncbi:MAG: sigma-70 family RNA polymerase sigma factor [Longimicrobiaceae bacterium]